VPFFARDERFSLLPGDFVQRKHDFLQKVYGKTPGTCYLIFDKSVNCVLNLSFGAAIRRTGVNQQEKSSS